MKKGRVSKKALLSIVILRLAVLIVMLQSIISTQLSLFYSIIILHVLIIGLVFKDNSIGSLLAFAFGIFDFSSAAVWIFLIHMNPMTYVICVIFDLLFIVSSLAEFKALSKA